jgi:hypothetical protein
MMAPASVRAFRAGARPSSRSRADPARADARGGVAVPGAGAAADAAATGF